MMKLGSTIRAPRTMLSGPNDPDLWGHAISHFLRGRVTMASISLIGRFKGYYFVGRIAAVMICRTPNSFGGPKEN